MAKKLVIVESPAKARTINKYLGKDFVVEASIGHIKDLPKSELGVDIENGFIPKLKTIRGKVEIIRKLRDLASKSEEVYVATDPDREGEAIADHIAEEIGGDNQKIKRVLFTEITPTGIARAMQNPQKIDKNLVQAQQARRVMDRLVGYKVSPLIWKTVYPGLSAGRVQSVALRLVCEREEAIKNFVPVEYWSIIGRFRMSTGEEFEAKLYSIDGIDLKDPEGGQNDAGHGAATFYIKNKEDADKLVTELRSPQYIVSSVVKKEQRRSPAPPFITSTLQQAASSRLGFSPKKTMLLAQQLYEGVELGGEGPVGLITYMRTDSTRLSEEAVIAVREYIGQEFGADYLPKEPRHFRKLKSSQDAHEAIRPTYVKYTPDDLKKHLPRELFLLYDLIWKRFVASQMSSAIYDMITVFLQGGKYIFRASDSQIKFPGFLQLYDMSNEDLEIDLQDDDIGELRKYRIPKNVKQGDKCDLTEVMPRQHFTKPPSRYTESSLVKELESLGIGRPSTYSAIVSTIEDRGYVELRERKLFATELGMNVNKILIGNLPQFFNVEFTAKMEKELDEVASRKKDYLQVMRDFYHPFESVIKGVEGKIDEIRSDVNGQQVICDLCGAPMIIKWSRRGRFLACSRYPECRNTRPIDEHDDNNRPTGEKCPECGSDLIYKNSKFGKFIGCSNYPNCKYTKGITTGVKCPECEKGELAQRFTKRKRVFYGCTNYPNCKYATWDEPVNISCPNGDSQFLLKKYSKSKGRYYKCPKCGGEFSAEDMKNQSTSTIEANVK